MRLSRHRVLLAGCVLALAGLAVLVISWWPGPKPVVYRGKTVAEWSAWIFAGKPQVDEAVAALKALGPRAVPDLVRQLHTSDPLFRKQVEAIVRRLPLAARRVVWPKLIRPDATWARRAAARALGIIGPPASSAVPELLKALHHSDQAFAWEAAMALTHFGREPLPGLLQAMNDPKLGARQAVVYALGQIQPPAPEAIPALIKALHDPAKGIRDAAAASLANIGLPAIAPLLRVVIDETGPVRDQAGAVVLQYYNAWQRWAHQPGDPGVDPTLAARAQAVETLGETGRVDQLVFQLWQGALRDPASEVRLAALLHWTAQSGANAGSGGLAPNATGRHGPEHPDLAGLALCIKDKSPLVREAAAHCLGTLGPAAQVAVPALTRLLEDKEARVRAAAQEALALLTQR